MTTHPNLFRTAGVALALSSALLAPLAMAQHAGHGGAPAAPASPAAATHASHASHADMKTMMQRMNDDMAALPMTGDADVDFAKMMRIHHIGAIDMAEAQLRDGKNPQMLKMAREIIAAQNREIAAFDQFLASKGHPQPSPAAARAKK